MRSVKPFNFNSIQLIVYVHLLIVSLTVSDHDRSELSGRLAKVGNASTVDGGSVFTTVAVFIGAECTSEGVLRIGSLLST